MVMDGPIYKTMTNKLLLVCKTPTIAQGCSQQEPINVFSSNRKPCQTIQAFIQVVIHPMSTIMASAGLCQSTRYVLWQLIQLHLWCRMAVADEILLRFDKLVWLSDGYMGYFSWRTLLNTTRFEWICNRKIEIHNSALRKFVHATQLQ